MASDTPPLLHHTLIIGGNGFLGSHIVKAFTEHPSQPKVSVVSRSPARHRVQGADYYVGDISKKASIEKLFSTLLPTIIVNAASPPANAGVKDSTATTIEGTHLTLALAAECSSAKNYIYISSTSIVSGAPFSRVTEAAATIIAPSTYHDPYSAAKATADAMVLAANRPPRLRTAVLRPCGMVGENDTQIIPAILDGLKQGMARVQLGPGRNKFDFVYAGNVADACVRCAEALVREENANAEDIEGKKVAGEAFFITNDEPMEFWGFARLVYRLGGDRTPPEKIIVVPLWVASVVVWLAEVIVWVVTSGRRIPAKFNRSQQKNWSLDQTFDISKAKYRLRWEPKITLAEGARRGVEEWTLKNSA